MSLSQFLLKETLIMVHIGVRVRSRITFQQKPWGWVKGIHTRPGRRTQLWSSTDSRARKVDSPSSIIRFSTFGKVEHPVRKLKQSAQSISLSPQISAPKFQWCDLIENLRVNEVFSIFLNLTLLMLIFLQWSA